MTSQGAAPSPVLSARPPSGGPLAELPGKLQAIGKTRGTNVNEDTIFVRGDKKVEYGFVARVMTELKNAGFKKLSLVTQVEEGK